MICEVDNDDNPTAECPLKTMEEESLTGRNDDSVDGENESSMNLKEKSENKAEKEISDGCNAENMPKSVNMEPSLDSKTSEKVEITTSLKSDEVLSPAAQTVVEMANEQHSITSQVDITEDKQQETRSQTNNLHTIDFMTATTTTADESSSTAEYADHITYTNEGEAIYTDPKTQYKYKWNAKEHKWVYWRSGSSKSADAASNGMEDVYENEHYKWCHERHQWIPKAQKADKPETEHYKWDEVKNAWIPKVNTTPQATDTEHDGVIYGIDKDGQRIYTDKDGVDFFWDCNKSAWFPKIDDDFMARYQMSYGFIDNTSAIEEERKLKEEAEERRKADELREMTEEARAAAAATAAGVKPNVIKRKATQEPPSWFDLNPEQNTKVYVSNLPLDITLDEFAEVMSKCGMIMRDPQTQKSKLKLYTEADGQIKGDGLCDYIKVESVDLALKILDESEVRGHKIRVQRAQFQMRGEYNPALKPKRKKKDKEKMQKMKEKLFDWRPEKMRGERSKNEKVVIIKNLFTPELFEKEVQLILDYQNDLREECSKCGTVSKVVIYDLHPEGVAQINMSCPEEADVVIQMMHGRYFGQRQLTAEHWDGKTKYKIAETETAVKSRLNNWDEFLESDAEKKPATNTEPTAAATSGEAVTTDTLVQE